MRQIARTRTANIQLCRSSDGRSSSSLFFVCICSAKQSAILLGIVPFVLLGLGAMAFFIRRYTRLEQEATAEVGSVAEEVMIGVRTVLAFNGQRAETQR